jgi:ABC-2 type transport system permease protein
MTTAIDTPAVASRRAPATAIPLHRVVTTELRKMFDTRSGFWLLAGIGILALLATGAVILFAPDDELTYNSFAGAIGVPMTVILPIIAILSVTGEWSQRSGLTTFTLVPHRDKVILAKALVSVGVAVVSIPLAFAVGAVGNLVGTALAGVDPVWDLSFTNLVTIVLANVLGLLVGFMLGVLIRSSAGAIVAYFIYSFLLPTLAALLASSQGWFRDLQPWVDFNFAQSALYDGALTATQWAHLGVTSVVWLIVPTAVGVGLVMRSEVK